MYWHTDVGHNILSHLWRQTLYPRSMSFLISEFVLPLDIRLAHFIPEILPWKEGLLEVLAYLYHADRDGCFNRAFLIKIEILADRQRIRNGSVATALDVIYFIIIFIYSFFLWLVHFRCAAGTSTRSGSQYLRSYYLICGIVPYVCTKNLRFSKRCQVKVSICVSEH